MSKFSYLCKKYRLRKKLKATVLSSKLTKHKHYITKLELGFYRPPDFNKCLELALFLKLNKEERDLFLETAFLERLGEDKVFLLTLYPELLES